jgi:hypothetical protein
MACKDEKYSVPIIPRYHSLSIEISSLKSNSMSTAIRSVSDKKSWHSPKLAKIGDINSLTAVGNTNPATDCFMGSVYPPGHEDECPPRGGPERG